MRFLQPTKARTNEVGTLESRCQNFSLSPILFLSSSCRVKNKKTKQKRCSAALAGVVVLSDIAATLRGPACCRTSQQHAARSSALSAIAATSRGPARCWPSQQRCDVQRVAAAAPEERCKLQCVDGQRRNNVASCNALGHRCSVARSCSVALPPAIAAAAAELYMSDFRRTSIQLSSIQLPSDFRPSNFRPTSGPASLLTSSSCVPADVIVLRPAYVIADVTACVIVLPSYALMSCMLDVMCPACCRPAA